MIDFSKVKNGGARESFMAPRPSSATRPPTGATASAPAAPATPAGGAPGVTATARPTAAAAPAPSVGMALPYKTPEQWGGASDYYKGAMDRAGSYQEDPHLSQYQRYNQDMIGGAGMPGSMKDFADSYDARYAQDKLDTRDQVMESMFAEGLGDSSVGGVQMTRELGKLANDRSMAFADRQTSLDEAAKGRIMSSIGAYGQGAGLSQGGRQFNDQMGMEAADRYGQAGDRTWRSIDDAGGRYTGLAGAYNAANYNEADRGLDSMMATDFGTTRPMEYDQGVLGRIGGVVGGVGSMINNNYLKKKDATSATPPTGGK